MVVNPGIIGNIQKTVAGVPQQMSLLDTQNIMVNSVKNMDLWHKTDQISISCVGTYDFSCHNWNKKGHLSNVCRQM